MGADSKSARKSAPSKGAKALPKEPTAWIEAHPVPAVVLLAVVILAALLTLFGFTVFTDFSASADFVYTQF